jgi:hypothetical protein
VPVPEVLEVTFANKYGYEFEGSDETFLTFAISQRAVGLTSISANSNSETEYSAHQHQMHALPPHLLRLCAFLSSLRQIQPCTSTEVGANPG